MGRSKKQQVLTRGRGDKLWLWLGCDLAFAPDLGQDECREAGTVAVDIQAHGSSLQQSPALLQPLQPLSGVKHGCLGGPRRCWLQTKHSSPSFTTQC